MKIPFSFEAPHISKDNRYYKRYNFLALPMEEYEVRQTYDRKRKSKLFLALFGHRITYEGNKALVSFEINVTNEGRIVESDYKVNFYILGMNDRIIVSWPEREQNHTTYIEPGRVKISSGGKVPIFPEETVNGLRFEMRIELDEIEQGLSNTSFEIKLFYSGGEDNMEGDFSQLQKSLAVRN